MIKRQQKWWLFPLLIFLIVGGTAYGADTKVTGLTADTAPTSDDLVMTVDDPGGTPVNKKATLANTITKAHGIASSKVVCIDGSGVMGGCSTLTDTSYQSADATLTALAGLTIADVSIIQGTGADAFSVLACTAANQIIGVNAAGDALECKSSLNVAFRGATPEVLLRDSDAAGAADADEDAGSIKADMSTTTENAEVSDMWLTYFDGGTEQSWIQWDASDSVLVMGVSTDASPPAAAVAGKERLLWDFDTATDNEVAVSSDSGVTSINWGSLNLVTTGNILGAININSDSNGMSQAEMTAAGPGSTGMYGTLFVATGAGTWNLPAAAAGMSFCMLVPTAAAVIINPDDSDVLVYDGTADTAGHQISGGAADGDYICFIAIDSTNWHSMGRRGTWTPGS
jgi:hypothetical protein